MPAAENTVLAIEAGGHWLSTRLGQSGNCAVFQAGPGSGRAQG